MEKIKIFLTHLKGLWKNPWLWVCEFMAALGLFMPPYSVRVAVLWGIIFPLIAVTLAWLRDAYNIQLR